MARGVPAVYRTRNGPLYFSARVRPTLRLFLAAAACSFVTRLFD